MPILELPMPPSANALWRANRGRLHRSDRYAEWRRTAGWELKAQRPGRIDGPVEVSIAVGRPGRRCRDIDNLANSLLDLLQANRVIEDDSLVTRSTTGLGQRSRPALCA
jgi:crossover junction endodeoxyribonuclease RusA